VHFLPALSDVQSRCSGTPPEFKPVACPSWRRWRPDTQNVGEHPTLLPMFKV